MATPLPITDADRALIKPYIILPMVLRAFERDTRIFLNFRTPDPYVDWIHAARERLSVEVRLTRFEAVRRGIRVYDEERTASGMSVHYLCRGHHGNLFLTNAEIAELAVKLMRKYLSLQKPSTTA
ncbi:hypothetical protein PSTEL_22305 [Paenibacillus stellifer]|uniref:Uncharacterized protein n=1 Tax=Paenibacillus stellifer TaxID=169760 RepID=A0A089LVA5_9BACL|nr:hypothetical protein [Paenibacillus stellifer]AIQ65436.1 hypothetical protein PSTEL_22305 [Paenibacillus stellifer]